jgi:hypothetical protein
MSKDARSRRGRASTTKLVLIGLLVVTVAAVAWPRQPDKSIGGAAGGDPRSDDIDTPVCTQLPADDAGSGAPTGSAAPAGDQPILAECPADARQASAMLHVPLAEPALLPPGWILTESTVLLQQNPDGTTDQQFHRIWRAPDFDPATSSCAAKILLDARTALPGETGTGNQTPLTALPSGVTLYGPGFRDGSCQGPPPVTGVTGRVFWTAAGVDYDLFTFLVPQGQAVTFASSV